MTMNLDQCGKNTTQIHIIYKGQINWFVYHFIYVTETKIRVQINQQNSFRYKYDAVQSCGAHKFGCGESQITMTTAEAALIQVVNFMTSRWQQQCSVLPMATNVSYCVHLCMRVRVFNFTCVAALFVVHTLQRKAFPLTRVVLLSNLLPNKQQKLPGDLL